MHNSDTRINTHLINIVYKKENINNSAYSLGHISFLSFICFFFFLVKLICDRYLFGESRTLEFF